MKLLLDNHTLIWFLNGDAGLSDKVRFEVENLANVKIISVASIWEMAIKISINKLEFPEGFSGLLSLIERMVLRFCR